MRDYYNYEYDANAPCIFSEIDIFSENGTVWYHILGKTMPFSILENKKTPKMRGFCYI